jgi:uncharacterized DUF497 family protein
MPSDIARIRQAVRQQRYQITAHANAEMADDDLEIHDIEHILLTGQITQRFTHDPRGTRYEVSGEATDDRHAVVVCRFLPSGVLRIITAYVEERDEEEEGEADDNQ